MFELGLGTSLGGNPKGVSQDLNVHKGAFTNYVDTGVHLFG